MPNLSRWVNTVRPAHSTRHLDLDPSDPDISYRAVGRVGHDPLRCAEPGRVTPSSESEDALARVTGGRGGLREGPAAYQKSWRGEVVVVGVVWIV